MRTTAASVAVSVIVSLSVVGLAVGTAGAVAVEPSQDGGEEEEDAVHDAKGEAGLEHGASLVDRGVDAVVGVGGTKGTKVEVEAAAGGDVDTVGLGDVAQVPDGGDECADEAEIDDGDEQGVGGRAVVAEEGEDGPGEREHRDDEENKYVVGRQGVDFDIAVDEPGEHAHGWDQSEDLHEAPKGEEDGEQHGENL